MRCPQLQVPLGLLLDRNLTPAAKLVWIVCHGDAALKLKRSHAPTQLAYRTGLARSTVYEAFGQLERTGWCSIDRDPSAGKPTMRTLKPQRASVRSVGIPLDLVESRRRPQAIICFGLLQALPSYKRGRGQFKWDDLSKLADWHPRTMKRAVHSLVDSGWVAIHQENRVAPISFVLQHADEAWKRGAQARIGWSPYRGQALMLEYLTLIVESKEFVDDAATGFLVNPRTQQLLEFDRFYPLHRVAFEFNGRQHYEPTERFSQRQVEVQRARDATKRSICARQGITLIVVHAEDLSLEGMLRKIGSRLPRRDLRCYSRTIRYLEHASLAYRMAASHAKSHRGVG